MNSMRAAVLWAHLLRGAAPHDSPLDTLVAASRGTAESSGGRCKPGVLHACTPKSSSLRSQSAVSSIGVSVSAEHAVRPPPPAGPRWLASMLSTAQPSAAVSAAGRHVSCAAPAARGGAIYTRILVGSS
jgi:hypothetical protein